MSFGLPNLNPLSMLSNAIESTCDKILPKNLEFVGDLAGLVADVRTGNYMKITEDLQDLFQDLPQQLNELVKQQAQGRSSPDGSTPLEPTPPPPYCSSANINDDALLAPTFDDGPTGPDDGLLAPTFDDASAAPRTGAGDTLLAPTFDDASGAPRTGAGDTLLAPGLDDARATALASRERPGPTGSGAPSIIPSVLVPSADLDRRATGAQNPVGPAAPPPRSSFGAPPEQGQFVPLSWEKGDYRGKPQAATIARGAAPSIPAAPTGAEASGSPSTKKASSSTGAAKAPKVAAPKAKKPSASQDGGGTKASSSVKTSEPSQGTTAAKTETVSASMSPDAFFKLSDKALMDAVRDGKIPESVSKDPDQMRRLQVRMNDITQMNQLITTMLTTLHEMTKAIIQNLRA